MAKQFLKANERDRLRSLAYEEAEKRYANVHSQNAFVEGYMFHIESTLFYENTTTNNQ